MPVHLPSYTRAVVIRYWLKGYSSDEIASKFIISPGAVTNIVNEWRNNLGSLIADDLRTIIIVKESTDITNRMCYRSPHWKDDAKVWN